MTARNLELWAVRGHKPRLQPSREFEGAGMKNLIGVCMLILQVAAATAVAAPPPDTTFVDVVRSNDHTAALKLIDQHVNVNTAAADGTTALHWAVHHND